ncbi:MAG: DUF1850 domain-containing protein [Burkholderiaceae bacterium]
MATTAATVLGICLMLADPQGGHPGQVFVPGDRFTLAWTHSIELERWEEDYVVEPGKLAGTASLHATAARIRGSGAGMEPPAGAQLIDGWYQYTPAEATPAVLRLSRSAFVPDYERCDARHGCFPLSHWLPSDGGVTEIRACTAPEQTGPVQAKP